MASLIRLSPSTAVAATASVGETMAPSTKAASHDIPGTTAWATVATTPIVASTSPIERSEIDRRFVRSSRSDEKNAAE